MTFAQPLRSQRSPAFRPGWAQVLRPADRTAEPRPAAATVYRPDHLLIHHTAPDASLDVRRAVAAGGARRNWTVIPNGRGVQLRPTAGSEPVDAWTVLSELRAEHGDRILASVGLDHLMSTAEQLGGNPFALEHGTPGLDSYGITGYSGRGPVSAVLLPVRRRAAATARVVVLDTGIGAHPWFPANGVTTTIDFVDGRRYGPIIDSAAITAVDAEGRGVADHLLGLLATHAGHGTFIAGLLRQTCPEAEIVALAVMGSDGIVPESTLTDALQIVLDKQREQPGWADAVVLSLGYYAETGEDVTYTTRLGSILGALAAAGVAIFCAAGNDATSRPSFPAALAIDPMFAGTDVMPLVSVAALNPDGSVAAFSNDGPWVNSEALGVNLISTAPVISDGSQTAGLSATGPGDPSRPRRGPAVAVGPAGRVRTRPAPRHAAGLPGRTRAAADPDNFHSGFASWSGTSFAAPILAGVFLENLVRAGNPQSIAERRTFVPLIRSRKVRHSR